MTCDYPHNTGQTAYGKGCRCARCVLAKSEAEKRTRRPRRARCRDCGGIKRYRVLRCDACERTHALVRVANLVIVQGECWIFTGYKNKGGYGRVTIGRGSTVAHKLVYEQIVGRVPDGLQLDHLCRTPACVNPDHLEPVTPRENVRRSRATYCREALPL